MGQWSGSRPSARSRHHPLPGLAHPRVCPPPPSLSTSTSPHPPQHPCQLSLASLNWVLPGLVHVLAHPPQQSLQRLLWCVCNKSGSAQGTCAGLRCSLDCALVFIPSFKNPEVVHQMRMANIPKKWSMPSGVGIFLLLRSHIKNCLSKRSQFQKRSAVRGTQVPISQRHAELLMQFGWLQSMAFVDIN